MRPLILCLAALVCCVMPAPDDAAAQAPAAEQRLTPSQVLANPDAYADKRITVEGLLVNEGSNFFTDLRVVLKDASDAQSGAIHVRPWLPLELPPGPPGAAPGRETLAAYLGKRVILQGTYRDDVVRGVGQTKVLVVESARRVE